MENVSSSWLLKEMDPKEYDYVILCGGRGETIAAWTFAGQGQRVVAIDRKHGRRKIQLSASVSRSHQNILL
jgi:choline dehydrogenase-like flavoprotein